MVVDGSIGNCHQMSWKVTLPLKKIFLKGRSKSNLRVNLKNYWGFLIVLFQLIYEASHTKISPPGTSFTFPSLFADVTLLIGCWWIIVFAKIGAFLIYQIITI